MLPRFSDFTMLCNTRLLISPCLQYKIWLFHHVVQYRNLYFTMLCNIRFGDGTMLWNNSFSRFNFYKLTAFVSSLQSFPLRSFGSKNEFYTGPSYSSGLARSVHSIRYKAASKRNVSFQFLIMTRTENQDWKYRSYFMFTEVKTKWWIMASVRFILIKFRWENKTFQIRKF